MKIYKVSREVVITEITYVMAGNEKQAKKAAAQDFSADEVCRVYEEPPNGWRVKRAPYEEADQYSDIRRGSIKSLG